MRLRALLGAALLVSATVAGTLVAVADEPAIEPKTPPAATQESDDTESMIEVWARHAMPGEQHRLLEKMVGRWDISVKYWMTADSPAVGSKGTCERKWILGKRFVLEEFDGGDLAMPFEGLAIYGYDVFEGKYTSAWVDTMSTAITTNLGTPTDGGRRIIFKGLHGDPWSGKKKNSRGVTRFDSETRHTLEIHEPGRDGKEFKILEIVYTRPTEGQASQQR